MRYSSATAGPSPNRAPARTPAASPRRQQCLRGGQRIAGAGCPARIMPPPAAPAQQRRAFSGAASRGDLQRVAAGKQQFASFDDMIQGSDVPILVDFYATWCGPCQIASKELETFSAIMGGAVKVVKIDTDKYPSISSRHSVQGLPTLVLFNKGKELHRIEGFLPAMQLADRVRYYLAK